MIKKSIADILGKDIAYDIFIVAGQSNAEGNGRSIKTSLFPFYRTDNDIKMLKHIPHITWKKVSSGRKIPVIKFTNFFRFKNAAPFRPANYGFSLFFANLYKEKCLEKGRKILLLSTAIGGTSFCCNHWGKGDTLSKNAMLDVDLPENYYYNKLKEFVKDFRSALSHDLIFIFGDMQQDWKKTMPNSYITSDATKRIVSELKNTAFVESDGLSGNRNDIIHFSKASQEELGKRYFSAFKSLNSELEQVDT